MAAPMRTGAVYADQIHAFLSTVRGTHPRPVKVDGVDMIARVPVRIVLKRDGCEDVILDAAGFELHPHSPASGDRPAVEAEFLLCAFLPSEVS